MQAIVQCGLIVDISNCLCCHLAVLLLANEDAVGFLQIVRTLMGHGRGFDFDVDFLFFVAVLAVKFQPDITVFERPDLS
jgi:hypothetical protein